MYRLTSVALLISLAACSHSVMGTGESLKARADGSDNSDETKTPIPDGSTQEDKDANPQVTSDSGSDAGASTCVPTTCEAKGFTCGSFTDCDGKARTCGACSGDNVCSSESGGSCKSINEVCAPQNLTLLGTCVFHYAPMQDPREGPCAVLYGQYTSVEYRDNVTALPALTLKSECEAKDTEGTLACSGGGNVATHTYEWIPAGSPNMYNVTTGCHTSTYANGCHETRYLSPNSTTQATATVCP